MFLNDTYMKQTMNMWLRIPRTMEIRYNGQWRHDTHSRIGYGAFQGVSQHRPP